jgi:hypothetical protein
MRVIPTGSRLRLSPATLALGAALVGPGCTPGARVLVHNASAERVEIAEVHNDASTRLHPLEPGRSQTFGPAVTWHVVGTAGRFELLHPGEAFASRGWGPGALYRFQIGEEGCVFALPPDAPLPAERFARQPPGYPLGPPACREEDRAERERAPAGS